MNHSLRPLLLPAAEAHRSGDLAYEADGTAVLRSPEVRIPPSRQYLAIRATFDDLNKAISTQANSPRIDGRSLRERYDEEAARYEELVAEAMTAGALEPDYGTYVFDRARSELYLVAPEQWHRLALVTSNSKLLTDPDGALSWAEIRQRLEGAVIGFAGISVGGNLLEGWLREARPKRVKVADPDWVELTNLNRGERMSLRHAVAPRSARFDPANPYDVPRVSKAEYAAYEAQLVDPYLEVDVYGEGITRDNLDRFLLGDGASEPPIDILVEEMDHLELKVLVRQAARRHRIDVLMLSDFGHQCHVLWNGFRDHPDASLGWGADDDTLLAALEETRSGDRDRVFRFVGMLCGEDFAGDEFQAWIEGRGEQPTGSLPQSGATAMASGAIGGKELALRVLGHPIAARGRRTIYDLLHRSVTAE